MKRVLSFIVLLSLIFIIGFASSSIFKTTFADEVVDLVIDYNTESTLPAIFNKSNGMLYPGKSSSGNMTIKNGLNNEINFEEFGMEVEVYKISDDQKVILEQNNQLRNKFLKNIELTIEYDNLIKKVLKGTVYSGNLYNFELNGTDKKIESMNEGEILSLKYSIKMKKSATAEISGIQSNIDFTFNLKEQAKDINLNKDSNDSRSNNSDDNDIENSTVVIEDEEVPLASGLDQVRPRLFIGYSDNKLKMEKYVNNAELITILTRIINYSKNRDLYLESKQYEKWYNPYIKEAYKYSLIPKPSLINPQKMANKEDLINLVIDIFNNYELADKKISFYKVSKIITKLKETKDMDFGNEYVKRADLELLINELYPEINIYPNQSAGDNNE